MPKKVKVAIDYAVIEADEVADKIGSLLDNYTSFRVIGIKRFNMSKVITIIETAIEHRNMSCRVYTSMRSVAMATPLLVLNPITAVVGLATAVGIVTHNLATPDPDYEIAKKLFQNQLEVTYKKYQTL